MSFEMTAAITLAVVVVLGLVLLYIEECMTDDRYWHRFDPDAPWGPVARCAAEVEGDDGKPVPCALTSFEHREVYGDE